MTTTQAQWKRAAIKRRYADPDRGPGCWTPPEETPGYLSDCGTWGIIKTDSKFRPYMLLHQPTGGVISGSFRLLRDAKRLAAFLSDSADWSFTDPHGLPPECLAAWREWRRQNPNL